MANTFGNWLRRARIRNALSQTELGEKVGVTNASISNWENNKSVPDEKKRLLRNILGSWPTSTNTDQEDDLDVGASPFAAWLTRVRLEKKLSVTELAVKTGLSVPALYNLEAGRISNPRKETVIRLEKALKTTLKDDVKEEIQKEAAIEGFGELTEFDPHNDLDLPTVGGIYVLYDISERPIYVGQGSIIRDRIRIHRDKFWFKAPIVHTAAYVQIQKEDERKQIETLLIRFLKKNAVINKQNVDR